MSRIFGTPLYSGRDRSHTLVSGPVEHPSDGVELIEGVKTLSEQIASYRSGGLALGSRELKDHLFDEDDVEDVDPSSEFGLDRFEKSEKLAATISRRMVAKKKQKLNEADPT